MWYMSTEGMALRSMRMTSRASPQMHTHATEPPQIAFIGHVHLSWDAAFVDHD